jgi:hypothetical protein
MVTKGKRRKKKDPEKLNVFRGPAGDFVSLRSNQVPEAGVTQTEFQQGNRALSETGGHPGGQFGSDPETVASLRQQALTSLQLTWRDIRRIESLSDDPAESVAASRALALVERAIEELEVGK